MVLVLYDSTSAEVDTVGGYPKYKEDPLDQEEDNYDKKDNNDEYGSIGVHD